ncbi:hypothetical protein GCM10011349_36800 [Novosphingobium indicum]|uniref:Uncharacterized protein n=1 Tax=Novosphingobium indicum TaxID=462949 RepID=A0ABQ2JZM5_9SPHN|nr:hypothetical protein GCM10011349_36800 [Novosphingobium indicum]
MAQILKVLRADAAGADFAEQGVESGGHGLEMAVPIRRGKTAIKAKQGARNRAPCFRRLARITSLR